MEAKWLKNGSLEASGRPLGGHRLRHRCVIDFGLHFWASWSRFGVDVGLMLGSFFGPQPERQIFWESCPRLHGGILFKGPRGSKNMKNVSGSSVRQEACSKSVLGGARARFGSILGSILDPKIGPKRTLKFEANFKAKF